MYTPRGAGCAWIRLELRLDAPRRGWMRLDAPRRGAGPRGEEVVVGRISGWTPGGEVYLGI